MGLYRIDIDRMPPLIMMDHNEDKELDEVYFYNSVFQKYQLIKSKPKRSGIII